MKTYFTEHFGPGTGMFNVCLRLDNEKIDVFPCYPYDAGTVASDQPILTIGYSKISRIQKLWTERLAELRLPAYGRIGAVFGVRKYTYLNLAFTNDAAMDQDIVFNMRGGEQAYQEIHDKVAEYKKQQMHAENETTYS